MSQLRPHRVKWKARYLIMMSMGGLGYLSSTKSLTRYVVFHQFRLYWWGGLGRSPHLNRSSLGQRLFKVNCTKLLPWPLSMFLQMKLNSSHTCDYVPTITTPDMTGLLFVGGIRLYRCRDRSRKNQRLITDELVEFETKATAGGPAKNINPTYSSEIHGWDVSWLELLVARLPPSSNHSSRSSQLKS